MTFRQHPGSGDCDRFFPACLDHSLGKSFGAGDFGTQAEFQKEYPQCFPPSKKVDQQGNKSK